jgi:hypothetical protein
MLRRTLLVTLVLLQLFVAPASLLAEVDQAARVATSVRANAGGWGLATPLIIAGVGIYKQISEQETFEASDILNRKVLGGLAGDFLTVAAFNVIAPALPVAPLLRNYFVMFGGFLGWEIGSGNLAEADWVSMLSQAGVATLVQHGIHMLAATGGLSLGPMATSILAIASAMAVAILLEELRGGPEAESADRAYGSDLDPGVLHSFRAGGSKPATPSGSVTRADDEYEALRDSLEQDDRDQWKARYRAYQGRLTVPELAR